MVNYFVCQCLFDIACFSKYNDDINEFINLIEDNGLLKCNFLILEHAESFYVCCKDTIHFCYTYYPELYETCMENCPYEYTDMASVNCLDLRIYGFEDICSNCDALFLKYFLEVLFKIEKK